MEHAHANALLSPCFSLRSLPLASVALDRHSLRCATPGVYTMTYSLIETPKVGARFCCACLCRGPSPSLSSPLASAPLLPSDGTSLYQCRTQGRRFWIILQGLGARCRRRGVPLPPPPTTLHPRRANPAEPSPLREGGLPTHLRGKPRREPLARSTGAQRATEPRAPVAGRRPSARPPQCEHGTPRVGRAATPPWSRGRDDRRNRRALRAMRARCAARGAGSARARTIWLARPHICAGGSEAQRRGASRRGGGLPRRQRYRPPARVAGGVQGPERRCHSRREGYAFAPSYSPPVRLLAQSRMHGLSDARMANGLVPDTSAALPRRGGCRSENSAHRGLRLGTTARGTGRGARWSCVAVQAPRGIF